MSYKLVFKTVTATAIALTLGLTACSAPSTEETTTPESETTEQTAETEAPEDADKADEKADEKAETEMDADKTAMEVDQTDPTKVVQAVFDAAKEENFKGLAELCVPTEESDEDIQKICNLAADDADKGEFVESFADGKITGDAVISEDGQEATVPIAFGPSGEKTEEMKLVNRDDKWYLSSF